MAALFGAAGTSSAAGGAAAGAEAGAAGAAGAAGSTAAGTAGAASAATGGMSLAGGGEMSAAPTAAMAGTPTSATSIMADQAAAQAFSASGNAAPASSGGNVSAAGTGAKAGSGFNNPQGFVGGLVQGILGTGNKPNEMGGSMMQAGSDSAGATPGAGSTHAGMEEPQGFLGLTSAERGQLLGQAINGAALRSQSAYLGQPHQGGAVQPMDETTGLPMMADGGDVAPGGAAVVGEQGPEVVTAQPGGGATVTPHPTGTPQAAPQQGTAPNPPASSGLWPHIGAHIEDALIFVSALQNPGMFLQMRSMQYNRQMQLAQMGAKDPQLLNSPAVANAVDSFLGEGQAYNLSAEGHNKRIAESFGVQTVPPGSPMPDGTVAPSVTVQATRSFAQQGIGVKVDEKGYMLPTIAAGSFSDRAAAFGWQRMTETRDQLVKNGTDWGSANIMAANQAISELSAMHLPPPKELINLALGDLTAEQAQSGRDRASARSAFGLHASGAAGRVVGEAGGRSSVAGASPTAEPGQTVPNLYLGKLSKDDPRVADLEKRGYTLKTDASGNSIAVPPEAAQPGTNISSAVAKPENIRAFNAATDIVRSLAAKNVADIFPDEGQNPGFARGSAQFTSWVAGYTDPAKAESARQLADSLKLQLDRLETGGVPRSQVAINAVEGLLGGIRDRSVTKQQYLERLKNVSMLLGNYDPTAPREIKKVPSPEEIEALTKGAPLDEQGFMQRVKKGEFKRGGGGGRTAQATPAPGGRAGASRAVGGTLKNLEAQLNQMVTSGQITREQAIRKLKAADAAGLPEE